MIIYYFLLLIPIILQHIKIKGISYKKKNKIVLNLFFLMLLLMLMLRNECVGNDTANYLYYFGKIARTEILDIDVFYNEFGFVLINKLISLFTNNSQGYLAIMSIITIVPIAKIYNEKNEDTSLTISLFCILYTFVMMFSGIRQMIAISIGCIAYNYTKEKKVLPFILTVAIATTIHNSAIILLLMYPLYYAKITKKWLYVVVPIMALIFIFNRSIFGMLSIILENYTRFDSSISETGAYSMIILFSLLIAFSFVIPNEESLNDDIIGLRNFLLFSLIIQFFAPLHNLVMRMNYYYVIFIPLLIPLIIKNRKMKMNKIALYGRNIMILFFTFYFIFSIVPSGALHVFPYYFFWDLGL